jgi:hypothetical protein
VSAVEIVLWDCPACGGRLLTSEQARPAPCWCGETMHIADPEQVCDAPFPDAADTRCLARPHAADEHDPEHSGINPQNGAFVRWRSSEYGP